MLKYPLFLGMLQFSQRKLQTELEGFTKRQYIVNTQMEHLQHRKLDVKTLVSLALLLEVNLEMLSPSISRWDILFQTVDSASLNSVHPLMSG